MGGRRRRPSTRTEEDGGGAGTGPMKKTPSLHGFRNADLPIQIELLESLLYDSYECRMKRVQKLCFTEKGTIHGCE